jgi:putative methyltransferase (TIGR04325 family)
VSPARFLDRALRRSLALFLRLTAPLRRAVVPVWSGVYERHADVPASGPGFGGDLWVRGTREYTEDALRALRSSRGAGSPFGDHGLLPLLVGGVAMDRRAHVLDFGGGMGIGYAHTRAALTRDIAVQYSIIENERVCAEGRTLFGHEDDVTFFSQLPETQDDVDIVYMRSALQYVEDYTALLNGLLRYRPRYFLFVTLSAGDIPTFATAQRNLPGSVLAYWFHDVREIVRLMDEAGYALLMRTASEDRLQGVAVPKSHRLERACNLLFARRDSVA